MGSGGLRLTKSGEKSATDAAALRAARLKKYEAFHGTGHSLSGKTSTFQSMPSGSRLGGGSTASNGSAVNGGGYTLGGSSRSTGASNDDEEMKDGAKDNSTEEAKPKSVVPFQGEGRRLR